MSNFGLLPTFTLECYLGLIAVSKITAVKGYIAASFPSRTDLSTHVSTPARHEISECFSETTWSIHIIRYHTSTSIPNTCASLPPPPQTLSVQAAWTYAEQLETVELDHVPTEDERCNLCYGEFAYGDCCQKPAKAPGSHLFGRQCLVEALLEDRTACPKCGESLLANAKSGDTCEDICEEIVDGAWGELRSSMLHKVARMVSILAYIVGETK